MAAKPLHERASSLEMALETLAAEKILEQETYLGALTMSGPYSLLQPQLERCS